MEPLATTSPGNASIDVSIERIQAFDSPAGGVMGAEVALGEDARDALVGALRNGLQGGAGADQIDGGLHIELGHAGLTQHHVLVALALVVGATQRVAAEDQLLRGRVHIADNLGGLVGGAHAALVQLLMRSVQHAVNLWILLGHTLGTLDATRLHLLDGLIQLVVRLDDNLLVLMDQGLGRILTNLRHLVHDGQQLGVQCRWHRRRLGVANAGQAQAEAHNTRNDELHIVFQL